MNPSPQSITKNQPPPLKDAADCARYWLRLAKYLAHRAGLSYEDTQEFAAQFAARMWKEHHQHPEQLPKRPYSYWRTCAKHDLQDFLKQRNSLHRKEVAWRYEDTEDEEGQAREREEFVSWMASPLSEVLSGERRTRLLGVMRQLLPKQYDICSRFYFQEESIAEIAEVTGRTPDAIKESLASARRRLQVLMDRNELRREEWEEYACLLDGPASSR